MNRVPRLLASVLIAALVGAAPALAGDAVLDLPAAELDAAVELAPEAAMAQAQLQEAQAQARIERSMAPGWLARASSQSRRVRGERDFREWDVSLEHGLRLPGKRTLDRSVGEFGIARAQAVLGDARRNVATSIMNDWYQCVGAAARRTRAAEDVRATGDLEQAVVRRSALGDASQMELAQARAERAAVQAVSSAAEEELRSAQTRLQTRGVTRACEAEIPPVPASAEILLPDPVMDPAVRAAAAAASLARARAARARAEKWSDPSLGLRYSQERAGLERIVGVFLSIPLPSRRLAAEADRAAAQSHIAESEQRQAEQQAVLRRDEALARLRAARARWHPLDESARLQAAASQQLWRAYVLGEVDLATALTALRNSRAARGQVLDCAVDVWHAEALVRLMVESQVSVAAADEVTAP
jgi:outer membrane protein, heavy metal efflux system